MKKIAMKVAPTSAGNITFMAIHSSILLSSNNKKGHKNTF